MAHQSHEKTSKYSGNSTPGSSPRDDYRDPEPLIAEPLVPPGTQVTPPPRGGDGDDYEEQ